MPALRDIQISLKEALLGAEEAAVADLVAGDGLDPRARLAVYRHHVRTTLTASLEAVYPVVCRLVDRRFFAYAADVFIRRHPPAGPCLGEWGAAVADFLADFEPCAALPFLPDVARLEWAVHVASQAAPAGDLDLARLRRLDALDTPRLRFVPRAGLAHLASPWPVDGIWRAHRDGDLRSLPALDAGGAWLEIAASGDGVRVRALPRASHALRHALARGLSLAEAAGAAFTLDPSLDLPGELRAMLDDGLFADWTLTTMEGDQPCR